MTDAAALVAERYTLPLLREILYGFVRFSDLATLTGAPRSLLTARLRKLEDAGIVEKRAYSEHPPRHSYHLTPAGLALLPVLVALKEWGDVHCRSGIQTVVFEHSCGAEMHSQVVCELCKQPLVFDDLAIVGGTHRPVPNDSAL